MKRIAALVFTALLACALCAALAESTEATTTDLTGESFQLEVTGISGLQMPEELLEIYKQQLASQEWVLITEEGELMLRLPATIIGETDWQGFPHNFDEADGAVEETSHEAIGDIIQITYKGVKDGSLRMTMQQKVKGRANGQRVIEVTVEGGQVVNYAILQVDDMTGLNNPESMINGTWKSIGAGNCTVVLTASRLDYLYELEITMETSATVTDTWTATLNYNGGNSMSASLYGIDFQHVRETRSGARSDKTTVGEPKTVMVVINNGTLTVNSSEDELSVLLFAKE